MKSSISTVSVFWNCTTVFGVMLLVHLEEWIESIKIAKFKRSDIGYIFIFVIFNLYHKIDSFEFKWEG